MQHDRSLHVTTIPVVNQRRAYVVAKRAIDFTLALLGLLLAVPIVIIIALLIKLDSSGPILFRQTRLGKNGRPFTFYKFRTMYHNADSEIHRRYIEALIRDQAPAATGETAAQSSIYKLTRDPRITRVGRLLRRSSLDELPQLLNVIQGDMSMVGPRPPLPYEVQNYQEWHKGRLATIPGITGLWQVRGRSRVTFDEMVQMDLDYIASQSLSLDLKILVLTIPAILSGAGAE